MKRLVPCRLLALIVGERRGPALVREVRAPKYCCGTPSQCQYASAQAHPATAHTRLVLRRDHREARAERRYSDGGRVAPHDDA